MGEHDKTEDNKEAPFSSIHCLFPVFCLDIGKSHSQNIIFDLLLCPVVFRPLKAYKHTYKARGRRDGERY